MAVAQGEVVPPPQAAAGPVQVASVLAATMNSGQGVSVDQLAVALAAAAAPKKGNRCYRCGVSGHRSADCTVDICVICEGSAHGDRTCHLLTAPKPRVLVYGYAH